MVETKKVEDVMQGEGTNLVYISGIFGDETVDFDGPVSWTRKFSKPTYPFVPVLKQYDPSKFKKPKFNYALDTWEEQDTDSQGQQITNLKKELAELKRENQDLKEENTALKDQIKQIKDGQTQTIMVLGKLTPAVQELTKFAANLQTTSNKEEGTK